MKVDNSGAFQEAVFEAIKAKHQNLHALPSPQSDPLLLELADMVLLLSAQLALLSGAPLVRASALKAGKNEGKSPQVPSSLLS